MYCAKHVYCNGNVAATAPLTGRINKTAINKLLDGTAAAVGDNL